MKCGILGRKKDHLSAEITVFYRIDYYWNRVLSITTTDGLQKYPSLSKLIKGIPIIPHGNADIEHGFSKK